MIIPPPKLNGACALRNLIAAAAVLLVPVAPVMAQATDPARATVEALDDGLLAIMKAGKTAGVAGRTARIGPVVDRAFPLKDARAAVQHVLDRKNKGKVLVIP